MQENIDPVRGVGFINASHEEISEPGSRVGYFIYILQVYIRRVGPAIDSPSRFPSRLSSLHVQMKGPRWPSLSELSDGHRPGDTMSPRGSGCRCAPRVYRTRETSRPAHRPCMVTHWKWDRLCKRYRDKLCPSCQKLRPHCRAAH